MVKKGKRAGAAILSAALVMTGSLFAEPAQVARAEGTYPDEILLGTFWESDENVTNTIYWSMDGVNFYELVKAYEDSTPNDPAYSNLLIKREEDKEAYKNLVTLHDSSILYTELYQYADKDNTILDESTKHGTYLMLSRHDEGKGDNQRFIPMIGYSNDLLNWAYPASGSTTNVKLSERPDGEEKYGDQWNSVADDFFVDENGTIWITVCLGYYAMAPGHDGNPLNDIMQPYLIKVEEIALRNEADPINNPGAPLIIKYSDGVPIQLPQYHVEKDVVNRIDSSFYEEDGIIYLCVKKDGVNDEIWQFVGDEFGLDSVQVESNWKIICEDAVTGFEGPSLTKFKDRYYLYTDKLKDYGVNPDGKAGIYVNVGSSATTGKLDEYTGWLEDNQFKVHTYNAEGNEVGNRHGTVITVTDPNAIRQIMDIKATTIYADYTGTENTPALAKMGWYQLESYSAEIYGGIDYCYWYENDVRQGLDLNDPSYRGKEIYDPKSDGWYWLDNCNAGRMAVSKDVLLPQDTKTYLEDVAAYGTPEEYPERWKWARYDNFGKMMKGQIHMHIEGTPEDAEWGYWWFDEVTGAMQKGLTEVYEVRPTSAPLTDRWGNQLNDSEGNPATKTVWYKVDAEGNRVENDEDAAKKTVYYDDVTGIMRKGEYQIDGCIYQYDEAGIPVNGWYPVRSTKDEQGNPIDGWHTDTDEHGNTIVRDRNGTQMLYWYENGQRQGYRINDGSYRGKEVFVSSVGEEGAWFWCDNVLMGAVACDKDVYQDSYAGDYGDYVDEATGLKFGKWVRYDDWGKMIKGWDWGALDTQGIHQYFDPETGAMAKGNNIVITNDRGDQEIWNFDLTTGYGTRVK